MDHLRHAVTDGQDGTSAVALPPVRAAALSVKAFYNHMFWCSRKVGGCGARLVVAAGAKRVPHFPTNRANGPHAPLTLTHVVLTGRIGTWPLSVRW